LKSLPPPPPAEKDRKMAYDEGLAQRVREIMEERPDFLEKKLFGGLCFLLGGNMACGIVRDELIVRVGPDAYEASLIRPHVRKFDLTGKAMRGWVMVSSEGYESDEDLLAWLQKGIAHAQSLSPK
jgi:hypothetical protein